MTCKKCGSDNISYQTVTESRKTGCLTILIYLILAISVLGWVVLIPLLLRRKNEALTYAVCQNCGNRWKI